MILINSDNDDRVSLNKWSSMDLIPQDVDSEPTTQEPNKKRNLNFMNIK